MLAKVQRPPTTPTDLVLEDEDEDAMNLVDYIVWANACNQKNAVPNPVTLAAQQRYKSEIQRVLAKVQMPRPTLNEAATRAAGPGFVYLENTPGQEVAVSQLASAHTVELFQRPLDKAMGWGLRTRVWMRKVSYLMEYTGDLVSWNERPTTARYLAQRAPATERGGGPDTVDAEQRGNCARFINHSTTPNCALHAVGPRVWVRTTTNIDQGQELTLNYLASSGHKSPAERLRQLSDSQLRPPLVNLSGDNAWDTWNQPQLFTPFRTERSVLPADACHKLLHGFAVNPVSTTGGRRTLPPRVCKEKLWPGVLAVASWVQNGGSEQHLNAPGVKALLAGNAVDRSSVRDSSRVEWLLHSTTLMDTIGVEPWLELNCVVQECRVRAGTRAANVEHDWRLVVVFPGAKAQAFHTDMGGEAPEGGTGHDPSKALALATLIVPVTSNTPGAGTTEFCIKGRGGDVWTCGDLRPGYALAFDGATVHRGGANATAEELRVFLCAELGCEN